MNFVPFLTSGITGMPELKRGATVSMETQYTTVSVGRRAKLVAKIIGVSVTTLTSYKE